MVDPRRLARMKPCALLINVPRAAIVDEDALYGESKEGHLSGAALDVWWRYPTLHEPDRGPSRLPTCDPARPAKSRGLSPDSGDTRHNSHQMMIERVRMMQEGQSTSRSE